jgi:hypothetical protein
MLYIDEIWKSGEGTTGKDAADTYAGIVRSNGDPVADKADDEATVVLFALQKFSLVSSLGNVFVNMDRERLAPYTWLCTGHYKSPVSDRQTNDASFSFTTGGGTQHITCSLQTIQKKGAPGVTPPDCQGTIGNTGDEVAGVDIYVPTFSFKVTFYVSPGNMSPTYVASLKTLSGKVNEDPIMLNVDGVDFTFNPGELLFINGEGSKRQGISDWEFTLNCMGADNVMNQTIGPITGINKDGFDYVWVRHDKNADATAQVLVNPPVAAYVERVYTRMTLSPLFLQTSFGQTNSQPWTSPSLVSGGGVTS